MTKCDFCKYSYNKDGKLQCPYSYCILAASEISEMLDKFAVNSEQLLKRLANIL